MIPVVVGMVVVGVIITGLIYNHKKKTAFREWVSRRGFSLDSLQHRRIDAQYPHLKCLHQGSDRYGYDFVTGSWRDRQLKAFHYHYLTESTDEKGHTTTHHHYLTVVAVLCEVPLKNLDIRPEGLFDKFGTFFGFEDINFESAEFSRKYHVSSDDRKWAYDVLHARCIEYLLERPPIRMHMHGAEAVAWFQGKYKPEAIEEAAETLAGVLDCLPRYVLQDHSQLATAEVQA
jgi:hypothetical protein